MNKRSYPRGIINPNYPGFQHLAHTLADHFIDHHQNQSSQLSNMSDSDFSEVESDLSCDRRNSKNSQSEIDSNCMNNNYICDDTNGNNIVNNNNNNNNSSSINLRQVEEILRTVFESNSSHLMTAIEMFGDKEMDALQMMDTQIGDDETDIADTIDCDLKTYLKRYDDEVQIDGDVVDLMLKKTERISPDEPPPDILQKSSSFERGFEGSADKPDILQNVSEENAEDNAVDTIKLSPGDKEDVPGSNWSITPVDIVGNFEQEVEREFGLLVTGYKNNNKNSESDDSDFDVERIKQKYSSNQHILNKVI